MPACVGNRVLSDLLHFAEAFLICYHELSQLSEAAFGMVRNDSTEQLHSMCFQSDSRLRSGAPEMEEALLRAQRVPGLLDQL